MADVRVRNAWYGSLKGLLVTVQAIDQTTVTSGEIKSHLDSADRMWKKLDVAHTSLLATAADDDAVLLQQQTLEPMEKCYTDIKSLLYNMKPASDVGPAGHKPTFKLPEMSLPSFDGKYEDWTTFEDLFKASIHRHPNLSGSQKLQYLKACTKGEAASLIKSFIITDANYVAAWTMLEQQYNNQREIIHSHVKKLLFQPTLKFESATDLQALLTCTLESVRSLKVLGRPTDQWDDILTVLVIEKFDGETKSEWARTLKGTQPPTFSEVESFIRQHIRTLHARGTVKPVNSTKQQQNSGKVIRTHHSSFGSCQLCKGSHALSQCAKLKDMTTEKRVAAVREARVCFNCLREGHRVKECQSSCCKKCDQKHHTLLHFEKKKSTPTTSSGSEGAASSSDTPQSSSSSSSLRINTSAFSAKNPTLLKTAIVDVYDSWNVKHSIRAFIDEGGEGSLIKLSVLKQLGTKSEHCDVTVTGVGDTFYAKAELKAVISLHSQYSSESIEVEVFAVGTITGIINKLTSGQKHNMKKWSHLTGLQLADPEFYNGREIDILLGGDVAPYILKSGLRILNKTSPVGQDTIFGWVLSGKVAPSPQQQSFRINSLTCEISNTLRKFWEMEEVPSYPSLTIEEEKCERHFVKTHYRLPCGRYGVRLPFNEKKEQLGGSREQAFRRLRALEKRFERQPQYKQAYIEFMREYEQLGHMIKATSVPNKVQQCYYLPHHFVLKEESTTTKQRTVFDGSAKTTSGVSLNDTLMVGATVQPDLFSLLLQFRYNIIALKADIAKMYRNFGVHEDDQNYQRILWREDPSEPVSEYILTTVTYGTGSAPFSATRCLNQLAIDEKDKFPLASAALLSSFYVDDYLGTAGSTEKAIKLVEELRGITAAAGMEIRKWCCNDSRVLESIPEELREKGAVLDFEKDDGNIKALGIRWKPASDQFVFKVDINSTATPTKRILLSEISKTFDPLGWLAPVTVNAKLLLQKVWIAGNEWDAPVSEQLQQEWSDYVQNLVDVEQVKIPRCVITDIPVKCELHSFCDSSELAMACALYLKCTYTSGGSSVNLITSKTKVAPLRSVSLPKLELCGAKLLAETVEVIQKSLPHEHQLYCWSDSTITLKWISSHSRRWKTFVANRVARIQELTPPEVWRHVSSGDNPADLPTRGMTTKQLAESSLWWHGPSWLQQDVYPNMTEEKDDEEVMKVEERAKQLVYFHHAQVNIQAQLFAQFSSLSKLCRCAVYLIRFVVFLVSKKTIVKKGAVSAAEIENAKRRLVAWAQKEAFPEVHQLKRGKDLPASSKLSSLAPYLDENEVLRVGGRIDKAQLPLQTRHPFILPHNHLLTQLIIAEAHHIHLHSGYKLTLSILMRKYWILRARDTVRHFINKCVTCRRARAATTHQLMGNLPKGRVTANRPFLHVGVDFAGPFSTKVRKGRHFPVTKTWFAIFVCLSSKAVHLEAVTSLSSEDFLACYERFVARRGVAAHIYSDCGTNFVGADRLMKEFLNEECSRIQQQFVSQGTTWHFNPPSAPHQGGLWEAGVKSVKFHFNRVVGQRTLFLEQFQTLLCRIEACLNSRPLCALSPDPSDIDALTPGHFLIGEPLTSIPEPDVTLIKENRLKQWDQVKQMTQHFWKRWQNEYLTSLQQRFKWKQKRDNAQPGDLVVVMDDQLPVTKWKLGRIVKTCPGDDGVVRSAWVKTVGGELKRPINKLSPLISINDQ